VEKTPEPVSHLYTVAPWPVWATNDLGWVLDLCFGVRQMRGIFEPLPEILFHWEGSATRANKLTQLEAYSQHVQIGHQLSYFRCVNLRTWILRSNVTVIIDRDKRAVRHQYFCYVNLVPHLFASQTGVHLLISLFWHFCWFTHQIVTFCAAFHLFACS
jgi:hypothetical protein